MAINTIQIFHLMNQIEITPRKYQLEIYQLAIKQNIIGFLDTGAGKTLISIMLIQYFTAKSLDNFKANQEDFGKESNVYGIYLIPEDIMAKMKRLKVSLRTLYAQKSDLQQMVATKLFDGNYCDDGKLSTELKLVLEQIRQHESDIKALLPNQPKKVVFLVPTIPLVNQQAESIRKYAPSLSVLSLSGGSMSSSYTPDSSHVFEGFSDYLEFQLEISKYHVLVMTPQLLINFLQHAYITISRISLLIFDECHHATKNHPYNVIMNDFYFKVPDPTTRPRIFGMTASPVILGSNTSSEEAGVSKLMELEANLVAKIVTIVKEKQELQNIVVKANEVLVDYDDMWLESCGYSISEDGFNINILYPELEYTKSMKYYLYHIARLIRVLNAISEEGENESLFNKVYRSVRSVSDALKNVGCFMAGKLANYHANNAYASFLSMKEETNTHRHFDSEYFDYKVPPVHPFKKGAGIKPCLKELMLQDILVEPTNFEFPDVTNKVQVLCEIIRENVEEKIAVGMMKNFKCLVFVEKRASAKALSDFINMHSQRFFFGAVLCGHATGSSNGVSSRTGSSENSDQISSINKIVLSKFKSGQLNLLVVTSVAEEGIDITECNLVIIFDLFRTSTAYVQSRGRARQSGSKYYVLVSREKTTNQMKTIVKARVNEMIVRKLVEELTEMGKVISIKETECEDGEIKQTSEGNEQGKKDNNIDTSDEALAISTTGALVTKRLAQEVLNRYIQSIPCDKYTQNQKIAVYISSTDQPESSGFICSLKFPKSSPLFSIGPLVGPVRVSKSSALQSASLQACKLLHALGILNDHLLTGLTSEKKDQTVKLMKSKTSDYNEHNVEVESESLLYHDYYDPKAFFYSGCIFEMSHDYILNNAFCESFRLGYSLGDLVKNGFYASKVSIVDFQKNSSIQDFLILTPGKIFYQPIPGEISFNFHPRGSIKGISDARVILEFLSEKVEFSEADVYLFFYFQVKLFSLLMRKRDQLNNSNEPCTPLNRLYLVLPLKEGQIDYKFVKDIATYEITKTDSNEDMVGSLALTTYNFFKYFVFKERSDLTLESPFIESDNIKEKDKVKDKVKSFRDYYVKDKGFEIDESLCKIYECTHANMIKNYLNPVKNMSKAMLDIEKDISNHGKPLLLSQLMRKLPMTIEEHNLCQLLPSILYRFENYCIIADLFENIIHPCLEKPPTADLLDLILTASSAPTLYDFYYNYETLEWIGDSAIKYYVTVEIFNKYHLADEGSLTYTRSRIISNNNLCRVAYELKLERYFLVTNFFPNQFHVPLIKRWVPARKADLVTGMTGKLVKSLSKKMMADYFEALTGALSLFDNSSMINFLKFSSILSSVTTEVLNSKHTEPVPSVINFDHKEYQYVVNVEQIINYKFRNKNLLIEALTHASYARNSSKSYQRLEFLGDSCLDYMVSQYFYKKHVMSSNSVTPAFLTELRQQVVNNCSLGRIAVEKGLHNNIYYDNSLLNQDITTFCEEYLGGDLLGVSPFEIELDPPKVLGDILEAIVGALIIDSNYDYESTYKVVYEAFMKDFIEKHLNSIGKIKSNPVRLVYENYQSKGYVSKDFEFVYIYDEFNDVWICNFKAKNEVKGTGQNKSKYIARRIASSDAISKIKAEG